MIDTITYKVQTFWNDLAATIERCDAKDNDDADLEDDHRRLWPHIKADIAKDEHREWMLASAICHASGNQHFDHIVRVWLRGDGWGDDARRERPPF